MALHQRVWVSNSVQDTHLVAVPRSKNIDLAKKDEIVFFPEVDARKTVKNALF